MSLLKTRNEHSSLIALSSPSKKALAKRERLAKEAIKKLGDKYLNVSMRKQESKPLAEVAQIATARKRKTA
jgi:hypothetical protein